MDILASVATALGGAGLIAAMVTLVRIAIGAERRRADDWRTAAQTSSAAYAILSANVDKLITTVEQQATSQRETLSLLRAIAADRRDAA